MWKKFEEFVRAGYTVRRIRQEMLQLGHDLTNYSDPYLITKMVVIRRESGE